ncbi:methionyl-tRNA formyltransferase [Patescibacteria group bacterium]|nr:methionyl-tRNA formyltransferase [Patescibacteria group bacterium]
MNSAILTSPESWFRPYAARLAAQIQAPLFSDHTQVPEDIDTLFILSYFRVIPPANLTKRKHNLVVHESALPSGRGWSPLFWQVIEGKREIPIVLFEATSEPDAGDIYLKDIIKLEGHELHDEIRALQAEKTLALCLRYLHEYDKIKPHSQEGAATYYEKRTPMHSKLDPIKTIKEQFNLIRTVDNENYPAYFELEGHKYILKISKDENPPS